MTPSSEPPKKKPRRKPAPRKPASGDPRQADLFEPAADAVPPKPRRPRAKKPTPPVVDGASPRPAPRLAPAAGPASPGKPRPEKRAARGSAEIPEPLPALAGKIPYLTVMAAVYVALVLLYDTLISRGDIRTVDWAVFAWRPSHLAELLQPVLGRGLTGWLRAPVLRQFDLFKLAAWGVAPFLMCLWWLDTGWFTTARWRRSDRHLLIGCCLLAVAAVGLVRFVPQLAAVYPPPLRGISFTERLLILGGGTLWVLSWLPAWEFLHRYFLLRRVSADFPKYGWLLVPLSETLYHLQKPPVEMAGMLVFSLLATWWALQRRNLLLPLLVHAAVEIALIILLAV